MNPNKLELALTFIKSHPDAAARELEMQSPEAVAELLDALPLKQCQQLIEHLLPPYSGRIFSQLPLELATELLLDVNSSRVSSILRCVTKQKRHQLLKALPEKTSTLCRLLLSYSEERVGAWMLVDIAILPANCSAGEATKRITVAENFVDYSAIPVADENLHIVGLADLKDLLRAKEGTKVAQLMREAPLSLFSQSSLAAAEHHEAWQHFDTLVVLNHKRQLVGLLRHVDLRRGLERFDTVAAAPRNELLGGIGEVYVTALGAMLDLLSGARTADKKSTKTMGVSL